MDLRKIEPQANQYRFRRMEIVPGIFGDGGLGREWGEVGRGGQLRTGWFASEAEAKDVRLELRMAKAKRGYE